MAYPRTAWEKQQGVRRPSTWGWNINSMTKKGEMGEILLEIGCMYPRGRMDLGNHSQFHTEASSEAGAVDEVLTHCGPLIQLGDGLINVTPTSLAFLS